MKKLMVGVFAAVAAAVCGAADLPAGYTQIPWIESDGSQWIVTDYYLTVNEAGNRVDETVEAKIEVKEISWVDRIICCASGASKANPQDGWFMLSTVCAYGGAPVAQLYGYTAQWPNKKKFETICPDGKAHIFKMDGKNNKIAYDDEDWTATQSGTYAVPLNPLCILGASQTVQSDANPSKTSYHRLYYFKVYNSSGEVVFDGVPARDDNATVYVKRYGLYDLKGGKFYPNNGTTKPFLVPEGCGLTLTVNRSDYASDEEAGAALVSCFANDAKSGDFVKIGPGKYQLSAATGPVTISGGIKVFSADGDPAKTIIDGGNVVNCVVLTDAADNSAIEGVTMQNGLGTPSVAGGLTCQKDCTGVSVSNCVVRNNTTVFNLAVLPAYTATPVNFKPDCAAGVWSKNAFITLTDVKLEQNVVRLAEADNRYQYVLEATSARLPGGADLQRCVFRTNYLEIASLDFHGWSSFRNTSCYISGTAKSTVADCVFEGSYLTNTVTSTEQAPGNTNPGGGGLRIGKDAEVEVTGCLFAGNVSYGGAGIDVNANATVLIQGCTFRRNRSVEWGRGAAGRLAAGVKVVDCEFDENISDESYATAFDVTADNVCLSNCVFRKSTEKGITGRLFGIDAAGLSFTRCCFDGVGGTSYPVFEAQKATACNLMFDQCLFNNCNAGDGVGLVGADAALTAVEDGFAVKFRGCAYANSAIGSLTGSSVGSRYTMPLVIESCTFSGNQLTGKCGEVPGGLFGLDSSGDVKSQVFVVNTAFGGNSTAAFGGPWASYGNHITYSASDKADAAMAEEASNITGISIRFADPENGNFTPRGAKLRNKGVKADWMDGATDLGEGLAYEAGVTTIHPCGETFQVGAAVAIVNPRPRVIGDLPDIGACETKPTGLLLMVR